jgi:hypothetical protein
VSFILASYLLSKASYLQKHLKKITILFILLVASFLLLEYKHSLDKSAINYTHDNFDMDSGYNRDYLTHPGAYYKYQNQIYSKEKAEDLLLDVKSSQISLKEAWFKPEKHSCCPLGSELCMPMTVSSVLLIRLPEEDHRIENHGFVKTEMGNLGWCPYDIHYYTFPD